MNINFICFLSRKMNLNIAIKWKINFRALKNPSDGRLFSEKFIFYAFIM